MLANIRKTDPQPKGRPGKLRCNLVWLFFGSEKFEVLMFRHFTVTFTASKMPREGIFETEKKSMTVRDVTEFYAFFSTWNFR